MNVSCRGVISIVIPVKDGGAALARCLQAIAGQEIGEEVELVIVDSGSRDASLELARQHNARVHEIPPAEFTHGASRNVGAAVARGELLVFISQDAYPVDEHWLERLTAPLRAQSDVGGVYGRRRSSRTSTPRWRALCGSDSPSPRTSS